MWSEEIRVGEAKPLRYFGRDSVGYRGSSEALHVLDAYCPRFMEPASLD